MKDARGSSRPPPPKPPGDFGHPLWGGRRAPPRSTQPPRGWPAAGQEGPPAPARPHRGPAHRRLRVDGLTLAPSFSLSSPSTTTCRPPRGRASTAASGTVGGAQLHRHRGHRAVWPRPGDSHIGAQLPHPPPLHRRGGHRDDAWPGVQQAHADELVGEQAPSRLAYSAFSLTVPVALSIRLSTASRRPSARRVFRSRSQASTASPAAGRAGALQDRRQAVSGTAKTAVIGLCWAMVTRPVASGGLHDVARSTVRRPAGRQSALDGGVESCSSALRTAARRPARCPWYWRTSAAWCPPAVWRWSPGEQALVTVEVDLRVLEQRRVPASWPRAWGQRGLKGSGSMRASTSPAATGWPSVKATSSSGAIHPRPHHHLVARHHGCRWPAPGPGCRRCRRWRGSLASADPLCLPDSPGRLEALCPAVRFASSGSRRWFGVPAPGGDQRKRRRPGPRARFREARTTGH